MSFILRTTASRAAFVARPVQQAAIRPFSVSYALKLKEGDRNKEDAAASNEHHKQDQLAKQKEGKNHWKPELASNSEEAVQADKSSKNESPEQLQERTKGHAEANSK